MVSPGDKIIVTITGIKEYGVFFEYPGFTGLIHISELSEKFIRNVSDFFKVGDKIKVLVLNVSEEDKKLNASYKGIKEKEMNRHFDIGFKTIEKEYDKMFQEKLEEVKK